MLAPVRRFVKPLPGLGIDVGEISEGAQGPETLAQVTDGSFHFALFPGRRHMAGAWDETVFSGEGQEPRVEAHQVAFVFGDGGRQVVEPDFAGAAAECLEGMDVAAHESFEALAVSEFEVHSAAVALDQAEGIELARTAVVHQRAEVSPIHIEAFTGAGLDAHVRTAALGVGANRLQVVLDDGDAAGVAQCADALGDDGGRRGGVALQQFGDGRLEGIELAGAVAPGGRRSRGLDVLGQRAASDLEMAGDLAQRPLLDQAQAVNVVDLIRGEHRDSLYAPEMLNKPERCCLQDPRSRHRGEDILPEPRVGREPRCCLQDHAVRPRAAKRLQGRALDSKPRCCLQDL